MFNKNVDIRHLYVLRNFFFQKITRILFSWKIITTTFFHWMRYFQFLYCFVFWYSFLPSFFTLQTVRLKRPSYKCANWSDGITDAQFWTTSKTLMANLPRPSIFIYLIHNTILKYFIVPVIFIFITIWLIWPKLTQGTSFLDITSIKNICYSNVLLGQGKKLSINVVILHK